MIKHCLYCNKEFEKHIITKYRNKIYSYSLKNDKGKFCSYQCYHLFSKGKPLIGKKLEKSRENIKKAIDVRKNNPEVRARWIQKMVDGRIGEKNPNWLEDRSKLISQDERNCYEYLQWTKSVRKRDKYKCRIDNSDCCGKLEVHHILSWREHPELHYQLNNGITLCHFHHPRVRKEEKRLIPTFQELVSVLND